VAAYKQPRKVRSVYIRVAIGLLTLILLVLFINPKEIAHDLAKADLRYVLAGFGVCLLALAARSLKWQFILKRMGIRIPFWRLMEVYTISYWFSTFLPGSLGGDIYKVYDIARATDKKIRPILAVIIERLTGVLALLALTVVALLLYQNELPIPGWLLPLTIGGAVIATMGLLAVLLFFEPLWRAANRILPVTQKIVKPEKIAHLVEVSMELRNNRRLFIEAVLLGIMVQVLVLLAYYLMARSISDQISLYYFFTLYPMVEIASMIPVSINGMGVREGLTVFSMQYYQITPAVSMSMGIMFRLIAIILAIIGGILLLRRKSAWKATATDHV